MSQCMSLCMFAVYVTVYVTMYVTAYVTVYVCSVCHCVGHSVCHCVGHSVCHCVCHIVCNCVCHSVCHCVFHCVCHNVCNCVCHSVCPCVCLQCVSLCISQCMSQCMSLCMSQCMSLCMFAVQELQITTLSRRPSTWVHGNNDFKTRIGETFAYLPASLDFRKLCYPSMPGMFTDIDVHRLCMLVGGYLLDCCRTHRDGVHVTVIRPERTHRDGVCVTVFQTGKNSQGWCACNCCLLYTSPSPRDQLSSRMPSSA